MHLFAHYVQAVLDVGALPMITFAGFGPSFTDYSNIKSFATRCSDVVWGCIEEWGIENVVNWYWCIWNEPNNLEIGGDISFENYKKIYESTVGEIMQWLEPHLKNGRPRIGGPSVDGFKTGWLDWISRYLTEIDNKYIGFVSWHKYGDWREPGRYGAPKEMGDLHDLIISKTPDYEARTKNVARLIKGRNILNVCGELNVNSDHRKVSRVFNQTVFGGAYYVCSLMHLIRGGADMEMWWSATDSTGPYGVMDEYGRPNPVFYSKKLFTHFVRFGDQVQFPDMGTYNSYINMAVVNSENGYTSAVIVHLSDITKSYAIGRWNDLLSPCGQLYKIDDKTNGEIISGSFDGSVTFHGYGVAVVTGRNDFEI